ncbi:MAG: CoA transferase [Rhizobiaceae bacterium]|nr:CoA transferase [Rhizobiaceae bacterium]
MRPLSGIRVLDLTHVLSGPFGTQILGDLGADVIKVEGHGGEHSRHMQPHFVGEDSVYFLSFNRNKRSVAIDLKSPDGIKLLRRLALKSDVVIENFRPGVLERLGLGQQDLRAEKPELIFCSISGFGQDGPYRDKPAFDMIVQALSGGMSITGEPGGRPVRAGIPLGDICAGLYAVIGILAALIRKKAGGSGEFIDISMLDCQAAMIGYQAAFYLHSGHIPEKQGTTHDSIASYGAFRAADGQEIVIAAWTQAMWHSLCKVMSMPEWADDPRFATSAGRLENREALLSLMQDVFVTREARAWLSDLTEAGVPAAPVNTIDQTVVDPQLKARGMVLELDGPGNRKVTVMGDPIVLAAAPKIAPTYPPRTGEHSRQILEEVLALTRDEIDELVDRQIIKSALPA